MGFKKSPNHMLVIAVLGNQMMKDSIDDVIHKKAVNTPFDMRSG